MMKPSGQKLSTKKSYVKAFMFYSFLFLLSLQAFAQKPVISSFSPTFGAVGSKVTISGAGFSSTAADNVVYFGAVRAEVLTPMENSLIVEVPEGATYEPILVTVNNLSAYSSQPFLITYNGIGVINSNSFQIEAEHPISGYSPKGVTSDLNGDGKIDMIALNYGNQMFEVFQGNSSDNSFSFLEKISFPTEENPGGIAVGDINGDGKPDVVVTNDISRLISVYVNTSSGSEISFASRFNLDAGIYPVEVSVGDLDGDGRLDLAVINNHENSVSVLRNEGTKERMKFADRMNFLVGSSPNDVLIRDMDNDNKPDLVVANLYSNSVSILKNISVPGSVFFEDRMDISVGVEPSQISAGDLNGDGYSDIVVAHQRDTIISILQNKSSLDRIAFSTLQDSIGVNSNYISISDLDGDGVPDLAVSSSGADFHVLKNTGSDGNITFTDKIGYPLGGSPDYVSIADLNGDEKPDLVIGGISGITILKNYSPILENGEEESPGDGEVTGLVGESLVIGENGIFPNPGSGLFNVNTMEKVEFVTVADVQGKRILALEPFSSSFTIDLTGYSKGVYVLTLFSRNYLKSFRIIKQ